MLAHAYTLIWMLGIWAIGFQISKRLLSLDAQQSFALGYPLGLSLVGIASLFLWLAGIPFNYIYWLSLGIGTIAFGSFSPSGKVFSLFNRKRIEGIAKNIHASLSLERVLIFSLVIPSCGLILLWLWNIQPVVWDSLVLYDWRAARIADDWTVMRFFEEFTQHEEFYNYDFSHPFLSSIWQAFVHKSGLLSSGLIYIGLIISALSYARIIVKKLDQWLIIVLLLVATRPMMEVITQVYSALPFVWYWILIFLVLLDDTLSLSVRRALSLVFLITSMLNRMEAPFWLIFIVWWAGYELWPIRDWKKDFLKIACFVLPVLAIFLSWSQLQAEAAQSVAVAFEASRSSYQLAHYASMEQILKNPQWLAQSMWLVTKLNPVFPYVLLAILMSIFPQTWTKQEKRLWLLMAAWVGMLILAMVFEISTSPDLWQAKARLLSRVSLPLLALSMGIIVQRLKTHWLH